MLQSSHSFQCLGSYWLTSSPCALSFPRTLGSLALKSSTACLHTIVSSLVHFDATSASSPFLCRKSSGLRSTSTRPTRSLLELSCPSAFPDQSALLLTIPSASRSKSTAQVLESPTPRVWLPSRWCQPSLILGSLFHSLRSWASPFKAFLQCHGRIKVSSYSLRSDALLTNLSACYRRSNGFLPCHQPYPFCFPTV